jgi:hypothetical protein
MSRADVGSVEEYMRKVETCEKHVKLKRWQRVGWMIVTARDEF